MTRNLKPWRAADAVEWTYERDEGDIVVFARSAEEAMLTLENNGFRKLDAKKLKRTGKTLAEYLATDGTQKDHIS